MSAHKPAVLSEGVHGFSRSFQPISSTWKCLCLSHKTRGPSNILTISLVGYFHGVYDWSIHSKDTCIRMLYKTACDHGQFMVEVKVIPWLNSLSTMPWRCMGEWRYNYTILDLGIRWRWMASFTSLLCYPWETAPGTHWTGGCVGPRAGVDTVEKRKISCPYQESNSVSLVGRTSAMLFTDWTVGGSMHNLICCLL
jgi:hypothetical protein